MRLEIELRFNGINHLESFYRYDHMFGRMVRGFQFRIRPIFVVVTFECLTPYLKRRVG